MEANRRHFAFQICKFSFILILTFLLLVPVLFIVGEEQIFYSEKVVYKLLADIPMVFEAKEELIDKI
mgnify:CR=1 FL=1